MAAAAVERGRRRREDDEGGSVCTVIGRVERGDAADGRAEGARHEGTGGDEGEEEGRRRGALLPGHALVITDMCTTQRKVIQAVDAGGLTPECGETGERTWIPAAASSRTSYSKTAKFSPAQKKGAG